MTSPEELRIECTNEQGVARELSFHAAGDGPVRSLIFDEALAVGDECEITPRFAPCRIEQDDPRYSGAARFTVTATAPIPKSLGTLEVKGSTSFRRVPVPTSDGSCFNEPSACAALVVLRLSDEAQPWADALDFETLVDDEPWSYPFFPGVYGAPPDPDAGTDIVFVSNTRTGTYGLGSGTHTIGMRAKLAGVDEAIRSEELELNLTCKESDGDGGCSVAAPGAASSANLGPALLLFALLFVRRGD